MRLGLGLKLGCAGFAALAAPEALAQASLATSSEYSSGSYGEGSDTTLLFAAVSAGYTAGDWSLEATLPWVGLEGPATFIAPDVPLGGGAARGANDKVSGLADLSLSLIRTLELAPDGATRLDITGRVQLPTGEEAKGLSTGETRYSMGFDLFQDVGEWTLFAGGGWRFNGAAYEDGAFASAGLAWTGASGVSLGGAFDFSEASSAGVDAASEMSAWVSLPMGRTARFQLYGVAGLSEGSPNHALGARMVLGG